MRTAAPGLAFLLFLFLTPADASSQTVRGVGAFAGSTESRQLRPRDEPSLPHTGLLAGAWVDVHLPRSVWSVLAEASYAERGGKYAQGEIFHEVQADYLGMTVAPEFHMDVAFVGAFVYGGPTLEVPLRTRSTDEAEPAFRDPAGQVLSVTGGGGVEVRLPDTYAFRLEIRHVEGLSAAFTGDAGDFRHRSTEILVRFGKRP